MNITLIGMMGSGKTTVGKELEKQLSGFTLYDTDNEIERVEGCSIPEIFKKFGEAYFREKETAAIRELMKKDNIILSTGGGVFETPENRQLLLEKSVVIYLKASPDVIFDRIKHETHRPLLGSAFTPEKISVIIEKRRVNYELAKFTIDTDMKSPYNIVTEIIECLNCA